MTNTLTQQLDGVLAKVSEYYGKDAALVALNFIRDNAAQLRADLALAERVRGSATGEVVEVGDGEEGQPRVLIHSTREDLKRGHSTLFKTVYIVPASAVEG